MLVSGNRSVNFDRHRQCTCSGSFGHKMCFAFWSHEMRGGGSRFKMPQSILSNYVRLRQSTSPTTTNGSQRPAILRGFNLARRVHRKARGCRTALRTQVTAQRMSRLTRRGKGLLLTKSRQGFAGGGEWADACRPLPAFGAGASVCMRNHAGTTMQAQPCKRTTMQAH
jgi:hypothetical protein